MATIGMIHEWDVQAIYGVFDLSQLRATGFVTLGQDLDATELQLRDWEGVAGDALREEFGQARADVDAQGRQAELVANAVSLALTQINACKTKLGELETTAAQANLRVNDDGTVQSGRMLPGQWAAMQDLKPQVAQLMADADMADTSSPTRCTRRSATTVPSSARVSATSTTPT